MSQPKEDSILPEAITTEIPTITHKDNNLHQELNPNSSPVLSVEVFYNRDRVTIEQLPSSQLEPVGGLTPEEQSKKEEDPDLTLDDF